MISYVLQRLAIALLHDPAATSSLRVVIALLAIVLVAMTTIGYWKIFEKAGRPGWHAVVPYFAEFQRYNIAWPSQTWLFWVSLLLNVAEIVVVGSILLIPQGLGVVLSVLWMMLRFPLCIAIAKSFGKSNSFGIGLWIADFVFAPLLGFGPEQYKGPAASVHRELPASFAADVEVAGAGENERADVELAAGPIVAEPLDAAEAEVAFAETPAVFETPAAFETDTAFGADASFEADDVQTTAFDEAGVASFGESAPTDALEPLVIPDGTVVSEDMHEAPEPEPEPVPEFAPVPEAAPAPAPEPEPEAAPEPEHESEPEPEPEPIDADATIIADASIFQLDDDSPAIDTQS